MTKHMLICNHDEKRKLIVCKPSVTKGPFDTKYGKEFTIPDSQYGNRLMITTNKILACKAVGDEFECKEAPTPKRFFPRMCAKIDGDTVCGLDMPQKDILEIPLTMKEIDKIKPGFRNFLQENDVTVVHDKDIVDQGINGYAHCGDPFPQNTIAFLTRSGDKQAKGTILHEYAHCREQLARKEKGLPPLDVGKTGSWEETVEGTVGVGHEARAEHFRKKMMPKIS